MRIRKNAARLSALSLSSSWISLSPSGVPSSSHLVPKTERCELNMSPWDAMAFAPHSDFSRPFQSQVESDNKVSSNVAGGESVTPTRSIVVSSKEQCNDEVKMEKMKEEPVEEDNDWKISSLLGEANKDNKKKKKKKNKKRNRVVKREFAICCIRSDGKGWQCKKEAKEGHSFCQYHLNKLKSYNQSYHSSQKSRIQKIPQKSKVPNVSATAVVPRVVPRRKKAKEKADSPEYYYYSGFSPSWGRKRAIGSRESGKKKANSEIIGDGGEGCQSSSAHDYIEDVFYDSTDDDDDDNGATDGTKKRLRKPIKARSLKSLL